MISLLLLGAYAAAKSTKALGNKYEWDALVSDYELERDFEKVFKLCGKGEWDVNWANTMPEINKTTVKNCITNLKTIPYLTNKDIYEFEVKAWDTKLQQIQKEKEIKKEQAEKELQEITNKIKNEPTHRKTINVFKTELRTIQYSQILYKMCKHTIWGKLVHNPPFFKWMEENDLEKLDEKIGLASTDIHPQHYWLNMPMPCGHTNNYEVWVINEPIGYNGKEIYSICRKVVESSMIVTKEEEDAKYHKVAAEDLLKYY